MPAIAKWWALDGFVVNPPLQRRVSSIVIFRCTLWQVDVREYYTKDGHALPGKKGIALSLADWQTICDNMQAINAAVDVGQHSYVLKLSGSRQLNLSMYNGKLYVAIREYYSNKNGEVMPGQKGLNLLAEQWGRLVAGVHIIQQQLSQ